MATTGGSKAIVAALLANAGIAVAKFVGFLVTGASSLLAESIHSVADSGNQGLLLLGGKRARRPPTTTHAFGYARARYFYSFVVALVLFSLGSVFSLYEGYEKLTHAEPLHAPHVGIIILVVAIGLEVWSFRTAIVEANLVRGNLTWWQFIRRSKSPELPVVLLEDFGALIGLVLALAGVVLAAVTGDPVYDAVATIAIGALLGVIAIVLALETKSLLLGESAAPEDVYTIEKVIRSGQGVRALLSLKTQHLGPEQLLVAAKVELEPTMAFSDVVHAIDALESEIRRVLPAAAGGEIYIEPDYPSSHAAQAVAPDDHTSSA